MNEMNYNHLTPYMARILLSFIGSAIGSQTVNHVSGVRFLNSLRS